MRDRRRTVNHDLSFTSEQWEVDVASPVLADELLTVAEVASALRRGRSTTYRLIMSGDIESVRIGGSRRVRKSDLDAYVASLTVDRSTIHGTTQ